MTDVVTFTTAALRFFASTPAMFLFPLHVPLFFAISCASCMLVPRQPPTGPGPTLAAFTRTWTSSTSSSQSHVFGPMEVGPPSIGNARSVFKATRSMDPRTTVSPRDRWTGVPAGGGLRPPSPVQELPLHQRLPLPGHQHGGSVYGSAC